MVEELKIRPVEMSDTEAICEINKNDLGYDYDCEKQKNFIKYFEKN
jgi:hypothetical protein